MESNINLIESLNIEYFRLHPEKDKFEAKMNLTTFHSQPFGMLNGGATCAFGEIVAGMASYDMLEKSKAPAGQTLVAYHYKPKKIEGYLLARGMLMHQGKRTHVWRIDMYDENELLISSVTVTNATVDK